MRARTTPYPETCSDPITVFPQLGHNDIIIRYNELQLSHLVGNKVSRAYNKAEHLQERREMMEWWSDYIESLTCKGNVISKEERMGIERVNI